MLAEQTKFDYVDNVTYIGISACGTSESAPAWRIIRITYNAGKISSVEHSGGTIRQIYKWEDRKILEYV